MKIISSILILTVTNLVLSATSETKEEINLYNYIAKNCSVITKQPDFKKQQIFSICSDWKEIIKEEPKLQVVDYDLGRKLTCKLYFHSVTSYCKKLDGSEPVIVPDEKHLSEPIYKNTTILCENLAGSFASPGISDWKLELPDFKDESKCKGLCHDYYNPTQAGEACKLSLFYLSSLQKTASTVTKDQSPRVNTNSNLMNILQGEVNLNHVVPPNTNKNIPIAIEDVHSELTNNRPPKEDVVNPPEEEVEETHIQRIAPVSSSEVSTPKQKEISKGEVLEHQETPKVVENIKTGQIDEAEKPVVDTNKPKETVSEPENGAKVVKVDDPDNKVVDKAPVEKVDTSVNQNDDYVDEKINDDEFNSLPKPNEHEESKLQPMQHSDIDFSEDMEGNSYFFSYFMVICVLFVSGYVIYHNKQKIMALLVEGRQGKRQYRGRRPNSANYHKLDSNLEEAISSSCSKNTSHVIY